MLAEVRIEEEEQDDEARRWREAAACNDGAGTFTALFFSEEIQDIARAKAICGTCELQQSCLEGAVARREPWGVWGGQLFQNGKILAFKRKRGRPPKNRDPLTGEPISPAAVASA
jgi:WhiB family transcriptional regulator, redox-sensing transcriptional regulator